MAPLNAPMHASAAPRRLSVDELASALDSGWMLFAGTLVFFMHVGFSMLEGGCVGLFGRGTVGEKVIGVPLSDSRRKTGFWFLLVF